MSAPQRSSPYTSKHEHQSLLQLSYDSNAYVKTIGYVLSPLIGPVIFLVYGSLWVAAFALVSAAALTV
jgi:hypothetical protein